MFPLLVSQTPVQYEDRVSVGREAFRPAADLLICVLNALEFNDCQDAADTTPHLFANIGTRSRVSLRIACQVVEVGDVAGGWEFFPALFQSQEASRRPGLEQRAPA